MFGLSNADDQDHKTDLSTGQDPAAPAPGGPGNYAGTSQPASPAEAASSAPPLPSATDSTKMLIDDPLLAPSTNDPPPEPANTGSGLSDVKQDNANDTFDSPQPVSAPAPPAAPPSGGSSDEELLSMKQQALQSLAPLMGKLEQTPEERFKTTMMLIQASDNSALLKDAHDAANQITDEKVKAQALLDVVNEINYFTHQSGEAGQPTPQVK